MFQTALNFLNQIFIQSPGDFLYFLTLIILSLLSLLMSFSLKSKEELPLLRRYTLGLAGMMGSWVLLLGGAVYSRVTGNDAAAILPPLERAILAANLLLVSWMFISADQRRWQRSSNLVLLLLLLLVTAGYIVTGSAWGSLAGVSDFNLTVYSSAWVFIIFAISVVSIFLIIVLFRDIYDAAIKLVFFVTVTVAAAITLYQITQIGLIGDYAGILRLGYVLGLTIIPIIIYRLVTNQYQTQIEAAHAGPAASVPDRAAPIQRTEPEAGASRVSAAEMQSVQLLKALGMILEVGSPAEMPRQIVKTALEILRAEVGVLLRLQDANYADVVYAYDKVMKRQLASISLNLDSQPTLVNAIERHAQRVLYTDRNVEELEDMYARLDIEQIGPVYFQPLLHNHEIVGILMLGLPYAVREFRREETELLTGFGIIAGSLLMVSVEAQEAAIVAEDRVIQAMIEGLSPSELQEGEALRARREIYDNLSQSKQQIAELSQQVVMLNTQLDEERNRLMSLLGNSEDTLTISQRIVAINDEQERLREERDLLAKRLQEAETALHGATAGDNDSVMMNMVEVVKREKEKLEIEKSRLQQQLDDMRAKDRKVVPGDVQRLLNRMIEEKSLLENERNQLTDKLHTIQQQLGTLGIEDGKTGLSELISQLYEDRTSLREQNSLLLQERDALLREREKLAIAIASEKERDSRISNLESELEHVAADREAVLKQREKIRRERDETIQKLNEVKDHRARLLAQAEGFQIELAEAREEQVQLRAQIQEIADIRSDLIHTRDKLTAENRALATEVEQLLAQVDGDPNRLHRVNEEGLGSLKSMIDDLSQERDRLEREANELRNQIAQYEASAEIQLEVTAARIADPTYSPQQPELLVGLVQELRTPMTSIVGYIDLLLGESAGILGEMQRKFLQRVSANINRLDKMIDSLISVTQLDTGRYRLEPMPVDVVSVVEEAITNASIQFREKGLAVTLDLDDEIPLLAADYDSITQIIGQLLSNAYLVSPPDSEITVSVNRRSLALGNGGDIHDALYIAIEDQGGGIHPDDIPRVFARKYKAENPLIQGLGDTGVGLSIAKALVEAHAGSLWVETKPGSGSIFQFAIPLDRDEKIQGE